MEANPREPVEALMIIPLTPLRFLRYSSSEFPTRTAVVCGEQRFTYAQFSDRTARQAGALLSLGLSPGDRVAFLSANCHRLLEGYYGVLEAGGVLLPLNIRLAPQELAYILTDAGAKILFLESQFLGVAESLRSAVPSVRSFFLLDGRPEAAWLAAQNYEDLLADAAVCWRDVME